MNRFLLLSLFLLVCNNLMAQEKRVLIEEFTGTACGNCPMGVYYIDSMQAKYSGVIAVSLHSFYPPYDAMNFSEIDTLFKAYAGGVPCGSIDRILWPGGKGTIARQLDSWDTIIRNRLQAAPQLTIDLDVTWNEMSRNISADVTIEILNNLPAGDYRIGLYVLEDSVTGSGAGYDQLNYYDKTKGNPFFGKGNPIIGYVHRHVARALLPSPWGLQGLIPANPSAGQNFLYTFNYNLPAKYNAEQVKLIAFVNRYSSDHKTDEAMNADEKKLISTTTDIAIHKSEKEKFLIYPNPVSDQLFISFNPEYSENTIRILDVMGKEVLNLTVRNETGTHEVNVKNIPSGVYSLQLVGGGKIIGNKLLVIH